MMNIVFALNTKTKFGFYESTQNRAGANKCGVIFESAIIDGNHVSDKNRFMRQHSHAHDPVVTECKILKPTILISEVLKSHSNFTKTITRVQQLNDSTKKIYDFFFTIQDCLPNVALSGFLTRHHSSAVFKQVVLDNVQSKFLKQLFYNLDIPFTIRTLLILHGNLYDNYFFVRKNSANVMLIFDILYGYVLCPDILTVIGFRILWRHIRNLDLDRFHVRRTNSFYLEHFE